MQRYVEVLAFAALVLVGLTAVAFGQEAPAGEGGFWGFLEASAPAWVVIAIVALRQVAEIVHKTIPDTATGALRLIDKLCQIIAMYVPSRK